MLLSVADRIILLSILQGENDVTTLRIMVKAREQLGFTEEEHKTLEFKIVDGGTVWKQGLPEKEFNLGRKATDTIRKAFLELSGKKKLTIELLPTFDKFEERGED